jgi:hypothetical protein
MECAQRPHLRGRRVGRRSKKDKNVDFDFEVQAINGREYPQTERLRYPQGTLVAVPC